MSVIKLKKDILEVDGKYIVINALPRMKDSDVILKSLGREPVPEYRDPNSIVIIATFCWEKSKVPISTASSLLVGRYTSAGLATSVGFSEVWEFKQVLNWYLKELTGNYLSNSVLAGNYEITDKTIGEQIYYEVNVYVKEGSKVGQMLVDQKTDYRLMRTNKGRYLIYEGLEEVSEEGDPQPVTLSTRYSFLVKEGSTIRHRDMAIPIGSILSRMRDLMVPLHDNNITAIFTIVCNLVVDELHNGYGNWKSHHCKKVIKDGQLYIGFERRDQNEKYQMLFKKQKEKSDAQSSSIIQG